MYDLTQRQIEILKHIVKEYTDTASPVGSETLEKKYDLGVSPATIRNETASMVKKGYLAKAHSSSGNVPTSRAIKLYINELMKEKELSVAEEVEAKENIWDLRSKEAQFLRAATKKLAEKTKSLAVASTSVGDLFFAGYSNILSMPEFYDIDVMKNLLAILDNEEYFDAIYGRITEKCTVILGDEFEQEVLRPYSFVFAKFNTRRSYTGTIGVIGPFRMRYEYILPVVRYYGSLVDEVADW